VQYQLAETTQIPHQQAGDGKAAIVTEISKLLDFTSRVPQPVILTAWRRLTLPGSSLCSRIIGTRASSVNVPKGVEHRPVAEQEVHVMLFEPAAIKHTGDVESDLTVHRYERI
jgi:hypothetical protein